MASSFLESLQPQRDKINELMNDFFDSLITNEEESYLRRFLGYAHNFTKGPGRRLLPICTVNTFIGLSSEKELFDFSDEIYQVSLAIELLHISALMIDDLIDQEELRRGLPTFHKGILKMLGSKSITPEQFSGWRVSSFEASSAIYGGNMTSYLGTSIISRSRFPENRKRQALQLYLDGLLGLTRGHLLDEYYKISPLDQISLEDYLILSSLKRGKQMETAVGLGAILGNARQSQMEPLMQAMNKIGVIEQIRNDYNGTFGDPRKKSIDTDIKSGQCTILTVIGYQSGTPEQRKQLQTILGNDKATPDQIETVRNIFKTTGAIQFVQHYENSLKNDCYNLLQRIYPGLKKDVIEFYGELLGYIIESD